MLRRLTILICVLVLAALPTAAAAQAERDRALIAAAYRNQSAFLIATSDGYVDLLRLSIAAGADVHGTDSYNGTGHVNRLGWTALLEAIILGDGGPRHTEVVRVLVDAGSNVDIAAGGGVSPLAHARARGYRRRRGSSQLDCMSPP